jgi:hypothetical protein
MEAGRAADAALDEIITTPPTAVPGMRTVIEYIVELDGHTDYLPTLLRSSVLQSPPWPAEQSLSGSERAVLPPFLPRRGNSEIDSEFGWRSAYRQTR